MLRFLACCVLPCLVAISAAPARADHRAQTAAPYFEAYADGEKVESLPLAATRVEVVIGGVIADVSLTQTYENRGDVPVEAIYVFPASSRATVYAVTMTVGDREIRAQLREREQARQTYEAAKEEGRSATLLEQQDVGAFRMNVANVLPGDRIKVELRYAEMIVPTKGVYEFFFPTTAPMDKYAKSGDPDSRMEASASAAVVEDAFTMKVHLLSGAPIAALDSPSHALAIVRPSEGEAVVTLRDDDRRDGARDFVLRYSMLGDDIGTGVLAYRGDTENFFLLTAQPPHQVLPQSVPPREYVFIVDVSGSMGGQPLDVSKALVRDLFGTLRPDDRFNVILFAGGSLALSEQGSLPATPDTLARALATLRDTNAGGGTELAAALDRAYSLPPTPGMARSLVIITDGAIAAGGEVSRLISSRVDEANVFVFGIGDSLDRAVIERLARAGQGEPFAVEEMSQATAQARLLREYIDRPVLTQATMRWTGADLYDLEPAKLPDLFAERPIIVVGKYRGELEGNLRISGYSGLRAVDIDVDLSQAYSDPALGALPLLWARRRIDRVQDEASCVQYYGNCTADVDAAKAEVTRLGLQYGVLTAETSFVAVTEVVRTGADGVTVRQPVPQRDAAPAPALGGFGFDPVLAAAALAPSVASPALRSWMEGDVREVAGHRMQRVPGGWRDQAHVASARLLRIRRDSDAFRALLQLRPALAEVFALEGQVLVAFGGTSVLITPDGFGDYPTALLAEVVDGD